MKTHPEIKTGVVYTVDKEFLFLPCRGYHAAISPGDKFLATYYFPSYMKKDGLAFHMVNEEASRYFIIEHRFISRLVEWKEEHE